MWIWNFTKSGIFQGFADDSRQKISAFYTKKNEYHIWITQKNAKKSPTLEVKNVHSWVRVSKFWNASRFGSYKIFFDIARNKELDLHLSNKNSQLAWNVIWDLSDLI